MRLIYAGHLAQKMDSRGDMNSILEEIGVGSTKIRAFLRNGVAAQYQRSSPQWEGPAWQRQAENHCLKFVHLGAWLRCL